MDDVALTRSQAFDLRVAIEEAAHHLVATRIYALAIALENSIVVLLDKLFPDLPDAS